MAQAPKIERVIAYSLMAFLRPIRNTWATEVYLFFLTRWGVNFTGKAAYISSTAVNFDGTDYSLFTIGEGVTISSYIRLLTHDWSPFTIAKSMNVHSDTPLKRIKGISIGDYSFIGTGTVIMPGATIGKGCLIGAGTVVRGNIPDYSIYIGSPGRIVGDTRIYMKNHFPQEAQHLDITNIKSP